MAAVLNEAGMGRNVSTVYLGDRVGIESLQIQDGTIILNMIVQGPNDPMLSGTQKEVWKFILENNQLIRLP